MTKFDNEIQANTVVGTQSEGIFDNLFTNSNKPTTEAMINYLRQKTMETTTNELKIKRKQILKMLRQIDSSIDIARPYVVKQDEKEPLTDKNGEPQLNANGTQKMIANEEARQKQAPFYNSVGQFRGTWHQFFPNDNIGGNSRNDYIRIALGD